MDIKAINSVMPQEVSKKIDETSDEVGDFDALLEEAKKTGDTTKLREATDALETVFINMMLKTMRSSIPETEGFFKKSESEKTFQGMLDEAYSEKMSKAGGIGISDMIFDQFKKSLYNEEDEKNVSSFELKG
jgi:flagellar protein FlgJ